MTLFELFQGNDGYARFAFAVFAQTIALNMRMAAEVIMDPAAECARASAVNNRNLLQSRNKRIVHNTN